MVYTFIRLTNQKEAYGEFLLYCSSKSTRGEETLLAVLLLQGHLVQKVFQRSELLRQLHERVFNWQEAIRLAHDKLLLNRRESSYLSKH